MQNLLIEERKQELSDEGKKDAAQQANDAELQRLEEVRLHRKPDYRDHKLTYFGQSARLLSPGEHCVWLRQPTFTYTARLVSTTLRD